MRWKRRGSGCMPSPRRIGGCGWATTWKAPAPANFSRPASRISRQRVEALLQDTNHRVGNSLATVSSLLALQVMRSRSDEVRDALEAARLRVHAIASAHRRLRLGDDLESASASEFLTAVIEDIA